MLLAPRNMATVASLASPIVAARAEAGAPPSSIRCFRASMALTIPCFLVNPRSRAWFWFGLDKSEVEVVAMEADPSSMSANRRRLGLGSPVILNKSDGLRRIRSKRPVASMPTAFRPVCSADASRVIGSRIAMSAAAAGDDQCDDNLAIAEVALVAPSPARVGTTRLVRDWRV